ncbi:hypothetical protein BLNAU_12676 [Blattamonas nauphoetae]|uniref:Uncharacterized protein n=1 Tax=Blattamonas nauphoetae TaxID=2049346 RepID=A0ABQ9XL07_9EUKA|nr:hypothetical protein BLNAU_12676 [Blattamonas nauphoetae]
MILSLFIIIQLSIVSELLSVQILTRHGEITDTGLLEQRRLGEFLRKRYAETEQFLSETYVPTELYVRSSASTRCIHSAQALLAGLYPKGWGVDEALLFPVQVEVQQEEYLLKAFEKCEECLRVYKQFMESPEHRKMIDDLAPTFDQLEQLLLIDVNQGNIGLSDELKIAQQSLAKVLTEEHTRFFDGTGQWPKAGIGLLLGEMFFSNTHADLHLSPSSKTDHPFLGRKKFRAYVAHDYTITALLKALNGSLIEIVPSAAVVIVELHKTDNTPSIQIQYCTQAGGEYSCEEVIPKPCRASTCQLTTFQQFWKNHSIILNNTKYLINNNMATVFNPNYVAYRQDTCQNTESYPPIPTILQDGTFSSVQMRKKMIGFIIGFTCGGIVLIAGTVLCCCVSRKLREQKGHPLLKPGQYVYYDVGGGSGGVPRYDGKYHKVERTLD